MRSHKRSTEPVAQEIVDLAGRLAATTCRWLLLIAEFDRRCGWHEAGQRSCAEWVAWHCAVAPGLAREHVRVARGLESLPRTTALFARGELSYSKVRALTRLDDVEQEEEVLRLAAHATAGQLERIVAGFRGVAAQERDAHEARAGRFLALRPREDGTVEIRGRLAAEEAAVLEAALDEFRRQLRAEGPAPGTEPGELPEAEPDDAPLWREQDRQRATSVDALVRLADAALAAGVARGRTAPERHQVVVHVELGSGTVAPPPARLPDGTALAPTVLRRLCCDGTTTTLLEREGTAIDVGRRARTVPPAMRRAVTARDGGCRFPGCQATQHLDAHHVEHWLDGGATSADNLTLLCRRHHTALHEGGFTIAAGEGGEHVYRRPDGRELPRHPALGCPAGRGRLPRAPRGARAVLRGDNLPYDRRDAVEVLVWAVPLRR